MSLHSCRNMQSLTGGDCRFCYPRTSLFCLFSLRGYLQKHTRHCDRYISWKCMRLTIYRKIFDLRDRSLAIIALSPSEKQFLVTSYTDPQSPRLSTAVTCLIMLFPQFPPSLPCNPFTNKLIITVMGNLE